MRHRVFRPQTQAIFSHPFRGDNMIAYCGLDCSGCDARLATREDSDERREETARAWSRMYRADIRPEEILFRE